MVKYECFRCGYIASQRINLRHHLNRKNVCDAIEDDVEIEAIKDYYGFEIESKTNPNESKMNPSESLKKYCLNGGNNNGFGTGLSTCS